ncbi:hypothetical protein Tco_0709721 [Tanacetum coccineum]
MQIYLNSQKKKRFMDAQEISKLCDYMLTKVLGKVKEINRINEHGFADPPLSVTDKEVMKIFELEIEKCLKLRRQMRMWESFVEGRPITNTRDPLPK